jgi:hypothetical protein
MTSIAIDLRSGGLVVVGQRAADDLFVRIIP